jgi:hypothetical protein
MSAANFLLSSILALTATALWPATSAAQQKWVPGKRFVQSATRVMGAIETTTKKTTYGYCEGICILAAFLDDKKDVSFGRWFTKGEQIVLIGGGDDGVVDLDIEVTDKTGKVIASDTDLDATPVVEFVAPATAQYMIKVKMAKSKMNGGFATLGILKAGGYRVPVDNLVEALTNLIVQCEDINNKTSKTVLFTSGNNQWAVFGSIVKADGDLTVEKLTPGRGDHVLIGGGDKTTQDIDLFLLDAKGAAIKEDTDADAVPRIVFRSEGQNTNYGFRVKNVKSKGASLILVGILTVDD